MKEQAASPWHVFRAGKISLRMSRRLPGVLAGLLFVAFAVLILHVGNGEYEIAPLDVLNTILDREVADSSYRFIVMELRLPRALVAWLVGAALGASGAIIQGLTRNPLASPDLTGVTAGASAAALLLIIFFPGTPDVWLPVAAFGGGVLVALLLYLLARRSSSSAGGDSPVRLILVGIGLSSALSAFTSFALTFGDLWNVQRAMMWLTGSVYATSWADVNTLLPWLVACLPLVMYGAQDLNALNLGEDVAQGLGLRLTLKRFFLLLLSVALAGVTVTVAGIVGFVGLLAPHLARRLVGSMPEGLVPTAAFVGGFLVVFADLVGRMISPPTEIPAGIVTSIIGVPFFLYLLWKREQV